nr:MAG TPA: hypothetical protein [Caudoviricetes sp.]
MSNTVNLATIILPHMIESSLGSQLPHWLLLPSSVATVSFTSLAIV